MICARETYWINFNEGGNHRRDKIDEYTDLIMIFPFFTNLAMRECPRHFPID